MELFIVKRNGKKEAFSIDKIKSAISKAFLSVGVFATQEVLNNILCRINISNNITVEEIQNQVEVALMAERYYAVAKAYILYRQKHWEDRDIRDKMNFLIDYCDASNAASGSRFDANANVENKNISTLIGELPKSSFIRLNRRMLTDRLKVPDHFEQIVYSINQPTGARNFQAVFWNISYYDRFYFESLFGNFVFPDGSKPDWESLNWLQKRFMKWFNRERTRSILTKEVMFNCEMIPAENVGVKHAKWDKRDGYITKRDCYNSYFYVVEDNSINIVDKFRLHGNKYIKHLTGGSALHLNLEEHLSKEQYKQLLRVATQEGCNYFTFNIPNTVCNDCGYIDKRHLKECPRCKSKNLDYLTRIIGYMKRVSNFSQDRQEEASRRHYAKVS